MNSDKFDRIVLDLLYGELDELTTAAAKRHMDQSARAREIFAHFKATRQLSVLPTHTPAPDFEAALMERERRTLAELPLHHRIGRIVSMLAGYAMRPQLIMGALLLLMIGSSLMFLRARPGQHSAVQVTERGAPEADVDLVLPVAAPRDETPPDLASGVFRVLPALEATGAPRPAEPTAAPVSLVNEVVRPGVVEASPEGLDPFDQALDLYRAGQFVEALQRFDRLARAGGRRAPEAALYGARSVRNTAGCSEAVSRFERVRTKFPGTPSAYEATLRGAKCLQQLGDIEAARQAYEALLEVTSYAERARAGLAALSAGPSGGATAAAGKAAAAGTRARAADSF
jgi:TolA-binding protein